METNWAAEHLQVIRTLMERSAVYRRALAPIMTFNGAIGQLDLNDNDLIVQSSSPAADFPTIITRIQSGRNAATRWSGNGIASSAAANDPNQLMGLGAILNDNGHGGPIYNTFDGFAVDMSSILIKYTLMGDLNLDGRVNADDFFLMDRGFANGIGSNQYYNGDIDYNGLINADDYTYIDRAYAMQVIATSNAPSSFIGISAVPEPTMVGFVMSLTGLLARRPLKRTLPRCRLA